MTLHSVVVRASDLNSSKLSSLSSILIPFEPININIKVEQELTTGPVKVIITGIGQVGSTISYGVMETQVDNYGYFEFIIDDYFSFLSNELPSRLEMKFNNLISTVQLPIFDNPIASYAIDNNNHVRIIANRATSYSIDGGKTWNDIASSASIPDGIYSVGSIMTRSSLIDSDGNIIGIGPIYSLPGIMSPLEPTNMIISNVGVNMPRVTGMVIPNTIVTMSTVDHNQVNTTSDEYGLFQIEMDIGNNTEYKIVTRSSDGLTEGAVIIQV